MRIVGVYVRKGKTYAVNYELNKHILLQGAAFALVPMGPFLFSFKRWTLRHGVRIIMGKHVAEGMIATPSLRALAEYTAKAIAFRPDMYQRIISTGVVDFYERIVAKIAPWWMYGSWSEYVEAVYQAWRALYGLTP